MKILGTWDSEKYWKKKKKNTHTHTACTNILYYQSTLHYYRQK